MKKITPYTYIAALAALLCTACSKSDGEGPDPLPDTPEETQVIGFGASASDAQSAERAASFSASSPAMRTASRAATKFINDEAFKQDGKFYVYSNYDYSKVDGKYTKTVPEFQKQLVTYDAVTDPQKPKWTYTPKKYWSASGAYHFIGCYPTQADIVSSSTGKNLVVNYSIHADNYDLMVAYHHRDMETETGNRTRPVELLFNHALSAIRLKMKSKQGKVYTLKNVHFRNLYTVGVLVYNELNISNCWKQVYKHTSSEIYNYDGIATDLITEDTPEKPTFKSDFLLAIPQTVNPDPPVDDKPKAELRFTIEVAGQQVTTIKTLPTLQWEAGKMYTYVVNVQPGAQTTIEVETTQWDPIDATSEDIIIE